MCVLCVFHNVWMWMHLHLSGVWNSASLAASVATVHVLSEGRGFKSHPRQQFFFERLLPWDLICIILSFLCLSRVSEYFTTNLAIVRATHMYFHVHVHSYNGSHHSHVSSLLFSVMLTSLRWTRTRTLRSWLPRRTGRRRR